MIDIRCNSCGRKLLEIKEGHAVISIKCPKCKSIVTIDTKKQERH